MSRPNVGDLLPVGSDGFPSGWDEIVAAEAHEQIRANDPVILELPGIGGSLIQLPSPPPPSGTNEGQ